MLTQTSYDEFSLALAAYDPKPLINTLFPFLCSIDEIVRWRCVTAMGIVTAGLADSDLEEARVIMRRYLWMLNDESGGIGWGVPEVMAESIYHSDQLAREYLHMLVSYTLDDGPESFQDGNFLELPRLQRGVLWGILRIAPRYKEILFSMGIGERLGCYLSSSDNHVRGLAITLCGLLRLTSYQAVIEAFLDTTTQFDLFHEGEIFNLSIGAAAEEALSAF
ncbi:MAG: HEAT repeat domain-containing protein [Desulfobulbaceae bacterium]|nr:MAG: HEAT repeat domain-containing protein [Desulfobulbaceae bacterium]